MDNFHRVSKREPCPVCGHEDWCLLSNDGGTAICMRTPSDRPHERTGGHIHVLQRMLPPVRRVRTLPPVRRTWFDAVRAMAGFRAEYEGTEGNVWESAAKLGEELGLTGAVVDRLLPGKSRFHQAWCFPMFDGQGNAVGIRLRRYGSSDKFSVSGSKDGLFYDPDLQPREDTAKGVNGREIVIVEGASDCAAGYEIGLPCVGRSSCQTGGAYLKELCARLKVNRVTIVTDNDNAKIRITAGAPGQPPVRTRFRPGIEGAMKLAKELGRMYRIVTPPKKDLRDWVKAGCTAETFKTVADLQTWKLPERN